MKYRMANGKGFCRDMFMWRHTAWSFYSNKQQKNLSGAGSDSVQLDSIALAQTALAFLLLKGMYRKQRKYVNYLFNANSKF